MTAPHPQIRYRVEIPDPSRHLFRVRLTLSPVEGPVTLALPAWIPGSYMIRDFAKHIVSLQARVQGRAVSLDRLDKQTWQLAAVSGELEVEYWVYAYDLSVRTAHVDDSHAYFNGTSLFLRVAGLEDVPHEVRIERPEAAGARDWRVATALPPVEIDERGFGRHRATDYAALIDCPVEISDGAEVRFDVDGAEHRMVFTGRQRADLSRISGDVARICRIHGELFGMPLPVTRYLFLIMVVGDGYGGLEHRDSSSLICSRGDLPRPGDDAVGEGYQRFLGLCSHEYFHLWNVKRIRPERFAVSDLAAEAYSELLWAFEGITSYYDDLALVRAGVISCEAYVALLARTITRLLRCSGRRLQSVAESSYYAWTKFYKQDENAPNAIVSYYTKGALVALGLDLHLRKISADAISLDDLMRRLWDRYGRTGTGVPEDGVERLATELAGRDLAEFFGDYVHGTAELPLCDWLAELGVGMRLRAARDLKDNGGLAVPDEGSNESRAVLGAAFVADNGAARLTQVFDGGAAQRSGLSPGDSIIAVDGVRTSPETLVGHIAVLPAGEPVEIHAFRRDELRVFQLRPQRPPADTCELWLLPQESLDDAVRARRDRWLGVPVAAGLGNGSR